MRLVSLLPSATEIVYALGLEDQLVGVTFECDEPPRARQEKAVVVGGRDTSGMAPADIDAYVKEQMAAGEDLYTLHADALAGLEPELILTQDLCRVCALPSGQVSEALDYLGCSAEVVSLDPYTLEQVLETIVEVGSRAGVPERASALVAELRRRLAAVAGAVAGTRDRGLRWSGWIRRSARGTGCPTWSPRPVALRSPPDLAPGPGRPPGANSSRRHPMSCW
jgi:iron complex transport system substrate-binding protein